MDKHRFPKPLKERDKAIIVSPSGNISSVYIDSVRAVLENWGLRVEVAPHARNRDGRFSGTAEQRLSDLQYAMDDAENRLIFCSRGGYGAMHLLEELDFEVIKKVPKWLVGYSDITALHQAFFKNDIVSVHAPMAKHLSEDDEDDASVYLRNILFGNIPQYETDGNNLNVEGETNGVLFGGNLAVFNSLLSTDFVNIPQNGILFIEDIGEQPYRIDRMIWTLRLAGVFDKINGLIVGSFSDCEEDPLMNYSVNELVKNTVEPYGLPIAFDFPVGHAKKNYPLLHGANMKLKVTKEKVELSKI